ncbi:MAG TPA: RNA polymerase sigma factor [Kofleriaceae bacterium]|nr:RNA polymerase sigma factor [Kofleriaceae bacterium]
MATEAELMGRYCAGDQAAFGELYDQIAPRLFRYLLSLTRERARAEDLLQVTFLKVHNARGAYVRGASPVSWMMAIARRSFIDEQRRQKTARRYAATHGAVLREDTAVLTGESRSGARDPEEAEAVRAAREAMAALPANQRQALELTKLDGLSVEEAAAAANTTRGAIKQRAHRAYVALRRVLIDDGESL